jgi:hypothetical protein
MEASSQKLILKGTHTQDEQTIEGLQIKEGDFMVVMAVKVT